MKRVLTFIVLVGLFAGQASADLFTFTYGSLTSQYNTGTAVFTADETEGSTGSVFTNLQGGGTALFDTAWAGPADFALSMNITNIQNSGTTADGSGSFTVTDIDGDTVSGNMTGDWTTDVTGVLHYDGVLSGVVYGAGGDGSFNGDLGAASMVFGSPQPWPGSIIELTAVGLNFDTGWGPTVGAGVTAIVTPLPGAVLLGWLGLSVAGLKLRRRA